MIFLGNDKYSIFPLIFEKNSKYFSTFDGSIFSQLTPIHFDFPNSDDEKVDKALNKKPAATRVRKKRTVADKPEKLALSESSDDENETSTKTRRSRSKSTEVRKPRGRPPKSKAQPPVNVELPPRKAR